MSANSSSVFNVSLLHLFPSNSSLLSETYCLISRPSSFIYTAFYITNILLLLPLCTFILHLGLQRCCQQRAASSTTTTSHSDSFTYHVAVMELIGVLGFILCFCGTYKAHVEIILAGFHLWTFTWCGETFFHILTCLERYLAVVHPIIYRSLKGERGIRIRKIGTGCVWLICFGATGLAVLGDIALYINFALLISSLIVISFCSLSVLFVLIRPGPGEQGGDRERVDKSKQRAFYTIVAILGVLLLRCSWNLFWVIFNVSQERRDCLITTSGVWFNVPCSLVLPLLFLHRAGALTCRQNNTK